MTTSSAGRAPAPALGRPVIVVSAVVLTDATGRVLTVRKRGTDALMHPGGKPEPGESAACCAIREVGEEIGLALDPARLALLGVHETEAANERGHALLATVFAHPALADRQVPEVEPAAEIAEVCWYDPADPPSGRSLAPLLTLLHPPPAPR